MKKISSIGNNNLLYRFFVLIVGFLVIFGLNYFLFAYFTGIYSNLWLVILWIFLSVLLWYLIKFFKYKYVLAEKELLIKIPNRNYNIPLKEIKAVGEIKNIPLINKFGVKFDYINNTLYLCPFSNKGIILRLDTHNIVICPRKLQEFKNLLKK